MARICVDQRLFATACGLCLCVALASTAVGDGGFLPPIDYSGQDLTEPSQRAVLVHWEGRESLFLFVDYHGAADKFAWIIPCPAKPDVRTASVNVLTEAAKYYHHLERLTWQEELNRRGLSDGDMGGGGQRPEDEDVRIHVIKQVGPYEIAIVSATEGESLAEWLNENGYAISPRAAPILKEYIDQQWFFAAVKVRAAAGRLQTLPPIVLRFQTDTPIYPLRISAISPGVVDIRVYCFRERIARIPGYEDRSAYALREDFCRHCPALSEEVADVPWHKMQISRITDTLVPQVMRRLDDRIHDQQPQGPQAFYPFVNLARTVGIAEALTASDAAVANWAEQNLPYYMYAKPRPGELPEEHLAALRETGKRQGYPLRDRLLAYIGAHVAAAKRRAAGFGRPNWSGDLMAAQNATGLEGAVILLVRTCEPGDRQVRDLLEEVVRVVGSGNYWGTALRELTARG